MCSILVVDIEFKKVMRQFAIMNGMLRVKPFPIQNELPSNHRFQDGALDRGPLLEEIVLRVHAFRNFMAAALQHHAIPRVEVNSHVCPVQFLLHNQRWICDEGIGFFSAEVLVIGGTLRAEKMRRPRIFNKVITRSAHTNSVCLGLSCLTSILSWFHRFSLVHSPQCRLFRTDWPRCFQRSGG